MANLKELRLRIASVKSTARITSAMKMVAAAKLRRAQEQAEAAGAYAERMGRMLGSVATSMAGTSSLPLLAGTGRTDKQLLVVVSADRGLCGGFNTNIARFARTFAREAAEAGQQARLLCVGRKAAVSLRRTLDSQIVDVLEDLSRPAPRFANAVMVGERVLQMFDAGAFDVCTVVYNRFVSALTQEVTPLQLVPFAAPADGNTGSGDGPAAIYEYEPGEEEILRQLLPRNLSVQIYRSMLESFASEQGARMTAMDNATRNAGDMIDRLTVGYNRSRQAAITSELIEIISGAEAL